MSQHTPKKAKYLQKYLKKYNSIPGIKSSQNLAETRWLRLHHGKVAKIFLLPAVACLILADTIVDHRTSIVKKAKEIK